MNSVLRSRAGARTTATTAGRGNFATVSQRRTRGRCVCRQRDEAFLNQKWAVLVSIAAQASGICCEHAIVWFCLWLSTSITLITLFSPARVSVTMLWNCTWSRGEEPVVQRASQVTWIAGYAWKTMLTCSIPQNLIHISFSILVCRFTLRAPWLYTADAPC